MSANNPQTQLEEFLHPFFSSDWILMENSVCLSPSNGQFQHHFVFISPTCAQSHVETAALTVSGGVTANLHRLGTRPKIMLRKTACSSFRYRILGLLFVQPEQKSVLIKCFKHCELGSLRMQNLHFEGWENPVSPRDEKIFCTNA